MFILIAVAVSIFAIVVDESARFLQMVTPERAAAAIWIGGGAMFLIKLVAWRLQIRKANADRAPTEPPIPDTGKTGRKYSR
jgi:hypothetical protein